MDGSLANLSSRFTKFRNNLGTYIALGLPKKSFYVLKGRIANVTVLRNSRNVIQATLV